MKAFRCVLPKPHEMVSVSFDGIRIAPNDKRLLVCLSIPENIVDLIILSRKDCLRKPQPGVNHEV
jgi:hypothetical protein